MAVSASAGRSMMLCAPAVPSSMRSAGRNSRLTRRLLGRRLRRRWIGCGLLFVFFLIGEYSEDFAEEPLFLFLRLGRGGGGGWSRTHRLSLCGIEHRRGRGRFRVFDA